MSITPPGTPSAMHWIDLLEYWEIYIIDPPVKKYISSYLYRVPQVLGGWYQTHANQQNYKCSPGRNGIIKSLGRRWGRGLQFTGSAAWSWSCQWRRDPSSWDTPSGALQVRPWLDRGGPLAGPLKWQPRWEKQGLVTKTMNGSPVDAC